MLIIVDNNRYNYCADRDVVVDAVLPELGGGELLPGHSRVPLGDGHAEADVGR